MTPSTFIIVPSYNEGSVIADNIRGIVSSDYEIVVVDDASRDDTWKLLQHLPVHALRHPVNLGQGAALQTGVQYALALGAAVLVHFDADGQHRIDDLPGLMQPVLDGEVDVVLGSRFLRKEDARIVPPARRLLLQTGRLVNFVLTGLWLTDAHNGFRVMNRRAATQIRLTENRMGHASEILAQIKHAGLKFVERPTTIVYTEYSSKKGQSAWNGIRIVFDFLLRRIFR